MRIAVVFDTPSEGWTPDDHRQQMERELQGNEPYEPEMEYQVAAALLENGHEVLLIGVHDDPRELLDHCDDWHPELVVNAAEVNFVESEPDYRQLLDYLGKARSGRTFYNPLPIGD